MASIFSATRSNVLLDGDAVEGLRTLAFRVVTEREDIAAVGSSERVGVVFGLRTVQGEITVTSANFKLDDCLSQRKPFQLVARLDREPAVEGGTKRTLAFDDCWVDGKSFSMSAGGTVVTVYGFTATRMREE